MCVNYFKLVVHLSSDGVLNGRKEAVLRQNFEEKPTFYKERDEIKCSFFVKELYKHASDKVVYIYESGR